MSIKELHKKSKHPLLGAADNNLVIIVMLNAMVYIILSFLRLAYAMSFDNAAVAETNFNNQILHWFVLHAQLDNVWSKPWTILLYMFSHYSIWSLITTILWLWGFGYILQDLAGNRKMLPIYFPPQTKYIAEPGRFFAARTTTIVMKILAKKNLQQENKIAYYLSNGVFGFFISSLYYEYNKEKILSEGWVFTHLASRNRTTPLHLTLLWGPTCDSGDKIIDGIFLPEMQTGDFLSVENMGAYTNSLETSFNGIPLSKPYYIYECFPECKMHESYKDQKF